MLTAVGLRRVSPSLRGAYASPGKLVLSCGALGRAKPLRLPARRWGQLAAAHSVVAVAISGTEATDGPCLQPLALPVCLWDQDHSRLALLWHLPGQGPSFCDSAESKGSTGAFPWEWSFASVVDAELPRSASAVLCQPPEYLPGSRPDPRSLGLHT